MLKVMGKVAHLWAVLQMDRYAYVEMESFNALWILQMV
jgi:hypothetical protein